MGKAYIIYNFECPLSQNKVQCHDCAYMTLNDLSPYPCSMLPLDICKKLVLCNQCSFLSCSALLSPNRTLSKSSIGLITLNHSYSLAILSPQLDSEQLKEERTVPCPLLHSRCLALCLILIDFQVIK